MNNKRQFLLGVFFVVALSLLAAYTLFLTDTVNLFSEPITMHVYFKDAHSLRNGNAVQVAGTRVGRVKEIILDPAAPEERQVLVILNLDQELELLEDYEITIRESTLLGGRHVHIDMGTFGGRPRDTASPLLGQVQKNPIEALSDLGDLFNENRASVTNIFNNLDVIIQDLREGRGPLGVLLTDEAMAEDLRSIVDTLQETSASLNRGDGLLGALINDPDLLTSVRNTVTSLETIAQDLQEGQGLAARLIYDDALANELQATIEAFSSIGQRIDRGEGVAGRLLTDQELVQQLLTVLDNFEVASQDLQAVAATVRAGEGSVGKLLMDEELYAEALNAVKLLTRSLEDYREAAPVSAFTSVLFSAF